MAETNAAATSGLSDDAASGIAYLTIIPAIIFLVVAPYNTNPKVKFHAWQSIFLFIAAVAIHFILLVIPIVGWILSIPVGLGIIVVWIICVVKAFGGQRFELPLIGKFAAQQAGA